MLTVFVCICCHLPYNLCNCNSLVQLYYFPQIWALKKLLSDMCTSSDDQIKPNNVCTPPKILSWTYCLCHFLELLIYVKEMLKNIKVIFFPRCTLEWNRSCMPTKQISNHASLLICSCYKHNHVHCITFLFHLHWWSFEMKQESHKYVCVQGHRKSQAPNFSVFEPLGVTFFRQFHGISIK